MSEGTLLQSGSYKSLVSSPGLVHELSLKDADSDISNNAAPEPLAKTDYAKKAEKKPESSTDDERRGKRDISHLTYYVKSMGVAGFSIFALCVVLEVAFAALQRMLLLFLTIFALALTDNQLYGSIGGFNQTKRIRILVLESG